MGRAESQFPSLAVLQVEHDSFPCRIALPTPTSLPQLRRMQLWKKGLKGACATHLLPDDAGDALDHLPHQGEIGVDPGSHASDVPGTEEQLMGGDLGFCRHIAQRHQHLAGDAHGNRRIEDARSYHRSISGRFENCLLPDETSVRPESWLLPSAESSLS